MEVANPSVEAVDPPMMGRNVHVYDGLEVEIAGPCTESAVYGLHVNDSWIGFWQHGNIRMATAYLWLGAIMTSYDTWALFPTEHDQRPLVPTGPALGRESEETLLPGCYIILHAGEK